MWKKTWRTKRAAGRQVRTVKQWVASGMRYKPRIIRKGDQDHQAEQQKDPIKCKTSHILCTACRMWSTSSSSYWDHQTRSTDEVQAANRGQIIARRAQSNVADGSQQGLQAVKRKRRMSASTVGLWKNGPLRLLVYELTFSSYMVNSTNKTFSWYHPDWVVCMSKLISFKLELVFLGEKSRKQVKYVHVKVNSRRTYHERNH